MDAELPNPDQIGLSTKVNAGRILDEPVVVAVAIWQGLESGAQLLCSGTLFAIVRTDKRHLQPAQLLTTVLKFMNRQSLLPSRIDMKGTHEYIDDPRNETILIDINGEHFLRHEAKISVFDSGFVLGDGVWEMHSSWEKGSGLGN